MPFANMPQALLFTVFLLLICLSRPAKLLQSFAPDNPKAGRRTHNKKVCSTNQQNDMKLLQKPNVFATTPSNIGLACRQMKQSTSARRKAFNTNRVRFQRWRVVTTYVYPERTCQIQRPSAACSCSSRRRLSVAQRKMAGVPMGNLFVS